MDRGNRPTSNVLIGSIYVRLSKNREPYFKLVNLGCALSKIKK